MECINQSDHYEGLPNYLQKIQHEEKESFIFVFIRCREENLIENEHRKNILFNFFFHWPCLSIRWMNERKITCSPMALFEHYYKQLYRYWKCIISGGLHISATLMMMMAHEVCIFSCRCRGIFLRHWCRSVKIPSDYHENWLFFFEKKCRATLKRNNVICLTFYRCRACVLRISVLIET